MIFDDCDTSFGIVTNYYPGVKVLWQFDVSLVYAEIFKSKPVHGPSGGVTIHASNVTGLCFDLAASGEIKYIECVGFKFQITDELISPKPTRQGNLVVKNPSFGCELDQPMELDCTKDRTLLRIRLGTGPVTDVVAPSEHILYTLSGDDLLEIWFITPNVYE